MADKCPKCGETLITRTIQKKMGLGSIDFPVAEICPKCNWNRDLTGAGDIAVKPPAPQESGEINENKSGIAGKVQEKQEQVQEKPGTPPKHMPEKPKKIPEKSRPVPEKLKPSIEKTRQREAPPVKRAPDMNKIITIALALLVIAGIIWAFLPKSSEKPVDTKPAQTPAVTATGSAAVTSQLEATPTGIKKIVKIDRDRGYIDPGQKNLNIRLGDAIVWKNDGSYSLTLVSNEGLFEDKLLDNEKETIPYVFKKRGVYNFNIIVKGVKKYNGTVVVEP